MAEEGLLSQLKRFLVGRPIPSHLAHHERLSKVTGLAVLSSDALSSVAYATEEIVRVLIIGGVAAMWYATPISILIAGLLATVAFSYRQTIYAYPSGGGAYIVAKENLGSWAGLTAAAALLIDYTLTVAVSIAAGVAALTSAFPELHDHRVGLAIGFIAVLMVGNLRGIRESGNIFSVPTYFFIAMILGLIGVGLWRSVVGTIVPVEPTEPLYVPEAAGAFTTFVLLRAFANGCTAMTGVEAVADGVPAFRKPEAKNAATTLIIMAVLAITMFVGITLLAHAYQIIPSERETVVSQLARGIFGGRGVPYYLVQAATMLILVLAANTAYADFPRLASIVARDKYLPRQFMNQGDRLAFSNGIVSLSVFAALLIVVFAGDTHALIPLYMIGVFISFTLSQTGMVLRAKRSGRRNWLPEAAISLVGALLTGTVLVIVAVTKVCRGRVDHPAADSLPRLRVHPDEEALRPRRGGALAERDDPAPSPEEHGARADQRHPARRDRGARVRQQPVGRRAGDLRGRRSGGHRPAPSPVGDVGPGDPARRPRLAVSFVDGAAARVHRAGGCRSAGRLRDDRAAGVRAGPLVAPPAAQPARAADQGGAAVQAEHGCDECAVSFECRFI